VTIRKIGKKSILPAVLAFGIAALSTSGCGGGPRQAEARPATVSGVSAETLHLALLPETYKAVGTIQSRTTSNVGAQVGGTVRQVRVKPGDGVRQGEVLAVLDDRGPQAQFNAAEAAAEASAQGLVVVERQIDAAAAQRAFAEATYQRYKALLAKASVSRQEFDQAEARYKAAVAGESALEARKVQMQAGERQAQAERDAAKTQFSYTRIVSPIDGIVTAKLVDAGTLVMPGTPLFTIEDPKHYRLEASLATELLPKVRIGETVAVQKGVARLEGRVAEIVPAADPASRTFLVKVELPPACGCRSGEYATAEFPVGESRGLSVPRSAEVDRGQLVGVFVIESQGIATYRLVKTGKNFGDRVEILSGLTDGERVATGNVDRLRDGVKVEAQ
jgi:membrane fusion protein, multidrug efflux system